MDIEEAGPSGLKIVTREYIYRKTKDFEAKDFTKKLDLVEHYIINQPTFMTEQTVQFVQKFSRLKSEMKVKWQDSKRTEAVFLKKYHDWLQATIEIPVKKSTNTVGRPRKSIDKVTDCNKRRKTVNQREEHDATSLLYAGQMVLRKSGNVSGAQVVKDIMSSPTRGNKYRQAFRKSGTLVSKITQLTPTQALSMFVEASLSRKQYEIIRESSKKLYPCYSVIQKAKQDCYPDTDSYRITETCAEIKLQALLDHSAKRLIMYLEDVFTSLTLEESAHLELTYKWGCDGSQQTQFKQKFINSSDSDANIFQSSLVPLQLVCKINNKIIWYNQTPSSPRFCRPMRIRFVHETKDITNEEINYHKEQIQNLSGTAITLESREVIVNHKLLFTMVDGKVCNAATNTASTMRCYICKATSKDFNNLTKFGDVSILDPKDLEFGLSILHARIRFFETLLHVSYKLTIKKWQIRTEAEKTIIKERKQLIQNRFKNELGLIVDVPKANYGNSNDGNTSRRFFSNAEMSADITEIDLNLIERFATVLEVISSGYRINTDKFSSYCQDTAKIYVQLYPWHPMSPTVHKILIHGPTVIKHALLPIGALSEEASEARNKHFRQYRERYSRKFCRVQCNKDIFNRLLLTSDPYLSCIRPKPPKSTKPFKPETMEMLVAWETDNQSEKDNIQEREGRNTDDTSDEEAWNASSD